MAKKVSKKPAGKSSKKVIKKSATRPAPRKTAAKKPIARKKAPFKKAKPAAKSNKSNKSNKPKTSSAPRAIASESMQASMPGVTLEHAKKVTPDKSEAFAIDVARMIRDDKCEDVVVLDVRGRSPVTDFLVIGSGTSDRQMRSVLQHVEDYGAKTGNDVVRRSVDDRATWILADFVDVVVHLFEPNTRAHYDLEMLWGDSKRVAWERPDQVSRDYAGLNS
jgi:ribosome-associated protein